MLSTHRHRPPFAPALLAAALLHLPAPAQSPPPRKTSDEPGIAARYRGGLLSWKRVDDYIGRAHRHTPQGREAIEHLLKIEVVQGEARRRGVVVDEESWKRFLAKNTRDLEQRGLGTLESWLQRQGIARSEFERLARVDLLLQELVRQDLGLPAGRVASPAQCQIWLEERTAASLGAAPASDPAVVARVDGRSVSLAELGRAVRDALPREALERLVRDAAIEATIEAEADRRGVALDERALDAELVRFRRELKEHPRLGSLSFAGYLEQLGLDERSLLLEPNFRTRARLQALVRSQRDREAWRELYEERSEEYDRSLGERRRVAWILRRAAKTPNALVALDFEEAARSLAALRERLLGGSLGFADAVRIYTDDDATREFEGRLGWVNRLSTIAEPALLEAIFATPAGSVTPPVRLPEGVALALVERIEGRPDLEAMVERVIDYHVAREKAALLDKLELRPNF